MIIRWGQTYRYHPLAFTIFIKYLWPSGERLILHRLLLSSILSLETLNLSRRQIRCIQFSIPNLHLHWIYRFSYDTFITTITWHVHKDDEYHYSYLYWIAITKTGNNLTSYLKFIIWYRARLVHMWTSDEIKDYYHVTVTSTSNVVFYLLCAATIGNIIPLNSRCL